MASIKKFGRVEGIYFASIVILALVGLFSPTSYNVLPAGPILEGILALCAVLILRTPKREMILPLMMATAYVVVSFILMSAYQPSNYLDFAQAFKAFIYIIPLCFFFKRDIFQRDKALIVLKILILAFAIKYAYSIALNITPRMGTRPGLLIENNFELIFLLIYFFVLHRDFGRKLTPWFLAVSFIILISGSRSSALALIVVFCGIYLKNLNTKTVFYVAGLAVLGSFSATIFLSRGYASGGLESIDRFRFMLVFIHEIRDWTTLNYIFGSFPITALSPESCRSLSFYDVLFSYSGNGSCYSVILHSYFFRVIFDHGAFGLVLLFSFLAVALRKYGYSKMDVGVVIGILSASALSVSAMNSVFVTLAIALAIGLRKPTALAHQPGEI
ncbi:conserved membrane hypothetical protein [Stenotrophomonas maltophilia]